MTTVYNPVRDCVFHQWFWLETLGLGRWLSRCNMLFFFRMLILNVRLNMHVLQLEIWQFWFLDFFKDTKKLGIELYCSFTANVTLYRICQSELRTRLLFTWDPSYIESWRGGDVPRGILTAAVLWITPIDNQFHHVPDQCGFQRVPPVVTDFIRISGHHSEEVHIENREFHLKISHFSFQ